MPSVPRDAATVILARRTADGGYEVLLTRRPETMRFLGGTFVFPGGALDEADCSPAVAELSPLGAADARLRIGEDELDPAVALGLHWCALRELFEEVGVLLAHGPVEPGRLRGTPLLVAALREQGVVPATDALVHHGRLITPESSPIRFDARFFVAEMPDGQELVLDPDEVPEARWVTVPDAIRAAADKLLPIPVPTMSILQGLSRIPTFEALMGGARVSKQIVRSSVSELVGHVLAPNAGLMEGEGTNTWIIGVGQSVIVDPAVDDAEYVEAVVAEASGRGYPSRIVVTHMHGDHFGGARALAQRYGVPVAAWKGVDKSRFDFVTEALDDGDVIRAGGATLEVFHTPGHASHHVCLRLVEERSLFTGDVVAGSGTVVISPPDGDLADYMTTLHRLASLDIGRIYPGHGPIVQDGRAKLAEYISHRAEREEQVLDALRAGVTAIPDMVKRIYADVDQRLHAAAGRSVLAHLEVLERAGSVRREGQLWQLV